MGCCISRGKKPLIPKNPTHKPPALPLLDEDEEEETVKEVLSETPNPKPNNNSLLPKFKEKDDDDEEEEDEKKEKEKTTTTPTPRPRPRSSSDHHINVDDKKNSTTDQEISEISSLSDTLSTFTDKRDAADRQRVLDTHRSPRHRSFSPARRDRMDPSPGRVKMLPEIHRRDAGESSGRRSTSPANPGGLRPGPLGRSPSSRRSGKSPGRVQPEKAARNWPPPTTNESLENPLVSLECFIFL